MTTTQKILEPLTVAVEPAGTRIDLPDLPRAGYVSYVFDAGRADDMLLTHAAGDTAGLVISSGSSPFVSGPWRVANAPRFLSSAVSTSTTLRAVFGTSKEAVLHQAVGVSSGGGGGGGGDASASNQVTQISRAEQIRDRLPAALSGGRLSVDGSAVTQPISAAALPLPAGAATSANQTSEIAAIQQVRDRLPTDLTGSGALLVGTARDKFRDNFATFNSAEWETVVVTPGIGAPTVAGSLNGARYLNIAAGTTVNAETIIRSLRTFKLPLRLVFSLSMSQRIANQRVQFEIVGVDDTGLVETSTVIAAAPGFGDASNFAAVRFDGTTATSTIVYNRCDGISQMSGAQSSQASTVATGSNPNFLPAGYYSIELDMDKVLFSSSGIDALTASTPPFTREQNIPNPAKNYKLQLRITNGAVAPASNTDVRLHFVRVLDTTRFSVEPRAGGRATDVRASMPVVVTSGNTVVSGAVTVASTTVSGTLAHDAPISTQAPVVAGAVARSTNQAVVADNDVVRAAADLRGATIVQLGNSHSLMSVAQASPVGTSDVALFAASGTAGVRRVLTSLTLANTGTTPSLVVIKDGTTAFWSIMVPANDTVHCDFAHGLRQPTANTIMNVALGAAGTVTVSAQSYLLNI